MTEQAIQSTDISVGELFKGFYSVPSYQREYVWEKEQVEQLLSDIEEEWSGKRVSEAPEYFIGSIVVCPGPDGTFELIDGQQRMTTLFVVLCALRDRLRRLGEKDSTALLNQIRATDSDEDGRDVERFRLELHYEDSRGVLESVGAGDVESVSGDTRSTQNILGAFEAATSFLSTSIGDDPDRTRIFYSYLTKKVKLIRIQTEDVAKALRVFETINDRGVGLDAMDLLKNLLFMNANQRDFDRLSREWKKIQDTIFDAREKPLRFLRYWIFSEFKVDQLREDAIYQWFVEHKEICGYVADPLGFVRRLSEAATAYTSFLDHSNPETLAIESMQLLGGRAARQHVILLLAGRKLDSGLRERLVQEIESLFFVYVITHEPTRNFERKFAQWAPELRDVQSNRELESFFAARFKPEKSRLARRFEQAFADMQTGSLQQYRLKYVLAKLAQYVDLRALGEESSARSLKGYMKGEYEIEHIHPQNPSAAAEAAFGELADEQVVEKLGNLILLEKSINASIGNGSFAEKRSAYGKSRCWLTRSLVDNRGVGVNTAIDRAVRPLECYEAWNQKAIEQRQRSLTALAHVVWGVPAGAGS